MVMAAESTSETQASYDRVADTYCQRVADELKHKPFDREILDRFAERVRPLGPVRDLGAGPGHLTRYLHDRGVEIEGIDLSPRMVELARLQNPEIPFTQADFRSLPIESATLGGVIAFYSLIHLPRDEVVAALQEIRRVLKPSGLLLIAFHIGHHVEHRDEWWGHPISLDFTYFDPEPMTQDLLTAGLTPLESHQRPPNPEVEVPTHRAYLLAMRPLETDPQ